MLQAPDDDFEEDGCTIDFLDDASDLGTGLGPVTFRNYEGEDFSQYLEDDDDEPECIRRLREQNRASWATTEADPGARGFPDEGGAHRRKSSELSIRERLSRILLSGSGSRAKSQAPPAQTLNRIHEVSFSNCRMGNSLVDSTDIDSGGTCRSAPGSDSGIDCSRYGNFCETESDVGNRTGSSSSSWWDLATQSARGNPRSTSGADLALPNNTQDATRGNPDEASLRLGPGNKRGKPLNAGDRLSDNGSKRLSSTFRKIYNTLNRRKSANLEQLSYAQNAEDIRL